MNQTESAATRSLRSDEFDAAIFDLDGVVTRTAEAHAAAWKDMFDANRNRRQNRGLSDFSEFSIEQDYPKHLDGKPRYDGIRNFLHSRRLRLLEGSPNDPPEVETVCGLGNHKQQLFLKRLKQSGVRLYPSTVRLIRRLREWGWKTGIISSSRNCAAVLEAAQIADLFDVRVDGVVADQEGLAGKPSPDVFLHAAQQLGISPDRILVVEDVLAGVEAAKSGDFGGVVAVDRRHQSAGLRERGADWVVKDLRDFWPGAEVEAAGQTLAHQLPSALNHLDDILGPGTDPPALFLDYDGTLTPIVAQPEEARLDDATRTLLHDAADRMHVAILSGRDLPDVRQRVGLDNVVYAGSHGLDMAAPSGMRHQDPAAEQAIGSLDHAEAFLRQELKPIPGVILERKRYGLAVHYRNVPPESAGALEPIVRDVASHYPDLRMRSGKEVRELQPALEWDKGKALLWLLQELGLESGGARVIYIGDDLTDEDALAALADRGVGIVVRDVDAERPTRARYALDSVPEVRTFLENLLRQVAEAADRQVLGQFKHLQRNKPSLRTPRNDGAG